MGLASGLTSDVNTCTDYEAKQFIGSFIDFSTFSSEKVQSITKKSDGVYEFTLAPSAADDLKESIEEAGGRTTGSVSATLTVTMDGENIKSYVYTATVEYVESGYKLKFIQTMDVQFN